MEAETSPFSLVPGSMSWLFPAVAPVVLISIGFVDPGKWTAMIDGGSRFGVDLVAPLLVFSFSAILCQYLSASIAVVTGRDLAQVCSEEYDKVTHMFLGLQSELSVVALDLTTVLGIAHCISHMFGVDLLTSIFLTAFDAVLCSLFATLLEKPKGKLLGIYMAGFILFCYEFLMLVVQPEIKVSMNVLLTRLNGESAFALMSLLGASIMPHNFYLHSAIVQQHQRPGNISKGALCQEHFFAILCIFSSIFLVNCVLMNSSANVFYNSGLTLLNFQDAISLMDQISRSRLAPVVLLLFLFLSNRITELTWNLGGQLVLHSFFGLKVPSWIHRATIRIMAVFSALLFVRNSGPEGLYQLLIFTQVLVAIMLPSSMIPLFRIASSRQIMGGNRVSQVVEFLSMVAFVGILGVKLIFVVEMVFGSSDWVANLRWNMFSNTSALYILLLIASIVSLCFMLWILSTPLKSATAGLDAQMLNLDTPKMISGPSSDMEDMISTENMYHVEESLQKQEASSALGDCLSRHTDISAENFDLPEPLTDSYSERHLTVIEEKASDTKHTLSRFNNLEESTSSTQSLPVSTVVDEATDGQTMDASLLKLELLDPVEKNVEYVGDSQLDKDEDEGDTWESEEPAKVIPGSCPSLASEGTGSFRSLSVKSEDGGNSGTGSLSRLAGLGRAARRQLATILDEFWGQLFDYHGLATKEAQAKKLDVLLGSEPKDSNPIQKVDHTAKDFTGYLSSGRVTESLVTQSLYNSPLQQRVSSNVESLYGLQKGPASLWSSSESTQLDSYGQISNLNAADYGERRYSSLRLPPSCESWDYQPATVHGYQIQQYLNRIAKDRNSNLLNPQVETAPQNSLPFGSTNYRDSRAFPLGQMAQNGLSSVQASRLHNLAVSRNPSLMADRSYYDISTSVSGEVVDGPSNAKKYHSLPDITGLSIPSRDSYSSGRNSQWDSPITFEQLYSTSRSRPVAPLSFDELSPSKVYKDAFSLQMNPSTDTRSLWSRQPFEQFGVADKTNDIGGHGLVSRPSSQEPTLVDIEAQLLQSFRRCILKLLSLEGSDWLFKQNDGIDEDLIDRVAAREKFLLEAETRLSDSQYLSSDRKLGSMKNDEQGFMKISSVPHCDESCVWKVDLIISFGVWCTHRILSLSLMESRPELWGKYTYVLNRLQGIIDLAFSKPRVPMSPCMCLQIPAMQQQKSTPPVSSGMLPPTSKPNRGKCTTAQMLGELIRDVETSISVRKGRPGTAAGDVAFPKGKENLASVLKRYKRRLASKTAEGTAPGSRKVPAPAP